MGKTNDDFDIETTVDLDNVDEKAAKDLLNRAEKADDIEIEVKDDTPAEDRGRKPLPTDYNPEPTEEELAAYSESVRARIEKLTKARHDERREKEQAARERDEAVQFAQRMYQEKQALEARAQQLVQVSSAAIVDKIDADIAATKKSLIEATNAYDTEAMADAQMKLADLVATKRQAEAQKSREPLAKQEQPVVQQQPSARPAPDSRAQDWAAKNGQWFQKDRAMTAFVFGVHEDLIAQGIDPRRDADDYYGELDKQVRARFPEKFADSAPRTPRTSPVAPVSRAVNGRKKVSLTTTELTLARRLGVTPEQFAAEKLKLENRNA